MSSNLMYELQSMYAMSQIVSTVLVPVIFHMLTSFQDPFTGKYV